MILEYILKFHLDDCFNVLSEKDNLGYFSIKIDFLKLFENHPDVGDRVLCAPIETLPICDKDIVKAQQHIKESEEFKNTVSKLEYVFVKKNVHARFYGLPVCPELHRTVFPKNVDLGCFLKVTGTVVRVTQSKMLEYQRKYVCMKCKYENYVQAEFERRYILKSPSKCCNIDPKCRSTIFSQVNLVSREYCKDYQEIKIQEQVNKLSIGTIPGSFWVVLEDDLVDCCKPGDDVIICGTIRRRWRPSFQTKKSEVELVLQANYIEVCNALRSKVVATAPDIKECFDSFWSYYDSCPLKGRDHILRSICPQVYGLHLVKLAVLLTVITGSNHIVEETDEKNTSFDDNHHTKVRGQCHLLLVGDPGTGKSQLLRSGADLTSRSVFTSGAGSTRAGLTCAALREDGEWQLEAGALVLSDGGVCCIDEISQLKEHDRTVIHEAMEQQTISIAKAGIVCKLNTRCAVIAACNPKGNYDSNQPLSMNLALGTPLLSRFDLIFILLDTKNKAWDKLVSSYILFGDSNLEQNKKYWTLEKLQMYISLVGPRTTKMTKSANIILQSYYMAQRKAESRDPSRTTVRMLDSLVRLSQAHCRLMYRTTIYPMDAIIAVSLVDLSMQDCTLSDTADALHSNFYKYPDFEYLCTAKKLLTKLNLYEIWRNELLHYGKLLQVDHKTLEHDIDSGISKLFAKYDDVADENTPLSASVITSSYFKKEDELLHNDKNNLPDEDNKDIIEVNKMLAVTLKKHATLNRDERKPPVAQKKPQNKRKRKEVTVNSKSLKSLVPKKRKKSKEEVRDVSSPKNIDVDQNHLLNAVPSVNDVFAEYGINLKFEDESQHKSSDKRIELKENKIDNQIIVPRIEKKDLVENKTNDYQEQNANLSTINKLKQFACEQKYNIDKYEEKLSISEYNNSFKFNIENKSTNAVQDKSERSSQISIFESSDCDIDLDL
ncbi:DNA helicase MCM9-like isoform X1 [Bombyx mandarina]|uniref:DNA helicase MCM9 n=2 Tax=Bombyx mandarina TaxID=7092 RepID=A0A6J2K3D4_BOMMA|nr:DNA helicase MCM9-like isoform X1 [Bombyx mandarina]